MWTELMSWSPIGHGLWLDPDTGSRVHVCPWVSPGCQVELGCSVNNIRVLSSRQEWHLETQSQGGQLQITSTFSHHESGSGIEPPPPSPPLPSPLPLPPSPSPLPIYNQILPPVSGSNQRHQYTIKTCRSRSKCCTFISNSNPSKLIVTIMLKSVSALEVSKHYMSLSGGIYFLSSLGVRGVSLTTLL